MDPQTNLQLKQNIFSKIIFAKNSGDLTACIY